MASGSFVNSTEPASARYSRERDRASFTTCDISQATTISTTAMMMTMTAPPPELLLSLDDEDERDEEPDDHEPPELQLRFVNRRKNNSPKKPTTPAMMTATPISCTSPFLMWVSSWPSTASISLSFSALRRPVVTVTEYCRGLRPVANAFKAGESMIFSFGMVMPREMQRFSSRL